MAEQAGDEPLGHLGEAVAAVGVDEGVGSPRNSERWVCIPDPWTPASGLGMKLAWTPCWRAISLTTRRTLITVSAMVSASV